MLLAITTGIGAGAAALLGAFLIFRAHLRQTAPRPTLRKPVTDRAEILFSEGKLIDSSEAARRLLGCTANESLDWSYVSETLSPLFGPLPDTLPEQPLALGALNDPQAKLSILPEIGSHRLLIDAPPMDVAERLQIRLNESELDRLRTIMALVPCPIWHTQRTGSRPTWYNTAYEDICSRVGVQPEGPSPFDIPFARIENGQSIRTSVGSREAGNQYWYEILSHQIDDGWLHFASSIDAVISSEIAQRNFLQTLTRIFAHLPIGLVVFDKDRRLVLFNPALIDLTSLPAEFLSGRPNLLSFFDMLREKRMMPEPKNYQNWRDKLSEVIAAASSDHYVETWNLSSGVTYKITGRPHPDGGIAFLFEDISAEISLTRRFRQEIEITQAVLDCLDDGVAVFSQLGVLTFCNESYRELWRSDPESGLKDVSISDATLAWQSACRPSPIWGDLRDFVVTLRDRAAWDAELELKGGKHVLCRVEPVAGGSTLVRFSVLAEVPLELRIPQEARV
ncbi:PAS-domain containing protein [Salipiger sp.]|uniref:PAS-domain containing protein n=1 Tax=Salipiger sp. TaxID=2078585 RepID=UPI003A97C721